MERNSLQLKLVSVGESKMDHTSNQDHTHMGHQEAGHGVAEAGGSHDHHAGHSVAMFRDKFWLSLALTIPVVFWSSDVQHWLGYTAPSFPGSTSIVPVLGTIVLNVKGVTWSHGPSIESPCLESEAKNHSSRNLRLLLKRCWNCLSYLRR